MGCKRQRSTQNASLVGSFGFGGVVWMPGKLTRLITEKDILKKNAGNVASALILGMPCLPFPLSKQLSLVLFLVFQVQTSPLPAFLPFFRECIVLLGSNCFTTPLKLGEI